MAEPPKKVREREERERLVKEFDRILAKLKVAKNRQKFEAATGELYEALEMDTSTGNLQRVEYDRNELIIVLEDIFENEEVLDDPARRREERENLIRMLQEFIDTLNAMSGVKDLANVVGTEKEFLSEKVPKDSAEHIASFLTGKKGSLGAQKSQLAVDLGRAGISSRREGGKKTKKNKSSKRKTRKH